MGASLGLGGIDWEVEPEVIGETLAAIVPPTPQAVAGLADAARRVRERQGIDPADTVRGDIAAADALADAPAADPNTVLIDLSRPAAAGWQIARKLIELHGIEKATTEAGYLLAGIKSFIPNIEAAVPQRPLIMRPTR